MRQLLIKQAIKILLSPGQDEFGQVGEAIRDTIANICHQKWNGKDESALTKPSSYVTKLSELMTRLQVSL